LARIFHEEIYAGNQGASNLSRHWEKIAETPTMRALYDVTQSYGFGYEPVFVGEAATPLFDERFLGFGFTRNTQVRSSSLLTGITYVLTQCRTLSRPTRCLWPVIASKCSATRFSNTGAFNTRSQGQNGERDKSSETSVFCLPSTETCSKNMARTLSTRPSKRK
jgi:hypothetical protein